jgi:hypothetical protein
VRGEETAGKKLERKNCGKKENGDFSSIKLYNRRTTEEE